MRRIHLFEFTDQPWYPLIFRNIQTDYLQFVTTRGPGYKALVPLFEKALTHSGTLQIVDLCTGSAGPWERLSVQLEQAGLPVTVTLTDKFPSPEVVQKWAQKTGTNIEYLPQAVNALQVPDNLKGMRTLFEGFHHFKPEAARMILRDAYDKRLPIGVFEASLPMPQGPLVFLFSPLMTLLGFICATPFIRPHTWSRFLWTYLLPIVPLATCWDGLVSFLRLYSQSELWELVEQMQRDDYHWEVGQASTGTPIFKYTYLLGYPL